jgi:hypothetical protein
VVFGLFTTDEKIKDGQFCVLRVSCGFLFQIFFSRKSVVGEFHPVRTGCWPRQPKNEPGPRSDREVCVHAI